MANALDIIIRAKNLASAELKKVTGQLNGLDNATKMALGGITSLAGGFAAMQAARFALEMAQLNTQLERGAFAFEHFSGSAEAAGANMRAVQRASGGMLTSFESQNLAVTAMTQGLATTSVELERVTKVARGIVAVSPVINDMETAFSQLALTIANQSMMRLDQLGTSAAELKPKIDDLKASNNDLTDQMAFQIALMDTLEGKYDPLLEAAVNQATGLERLTKALRENRAALAGNFAWINTIAGPLADLVERAGDAAEAMELVTNPPENATAEQKAIIDAMKAQMDMASQRKISQNEAEKNIQALLQSYYRLQDAAVQAGQAEAAAAKAAADEQDRQAEAMRATLLAIEKMTKAGAERVFQQVFASTGDAEEAARAYDAALSAINFQLGELQHNNAFNPDQLLAALPVIISELEDRIGNMFEEPEQNLAELHSALKSLTSDLAEAAKVRVFEETEGDLDAARQAFVDTRKALDDFINAATQNVDLQNVDDMRAAYSELLTLLPSVAQMLAETGNAAAGAASGFDMLADGIRNALSAAGKVGTAVTGVTEGIGSTIADVLGKMVDMTDDIGMDLFAIGSDFGQGIEGGRDYVASMLPEVQKQILAWAELGANVDEITNILLPRYLSDLESGNAELYRTERTMANINSEFDSIRSAASSIISGAIGPVAGVDANDLLPREDAVNENARRLADIAVNGLKGQDWLAEFAAEVPGIWDEIANSGDPQGTAARILKDFQDGLRPELLDKERAKELVKRALQGDANTKALIDEIAADLANELGISLSEAKEAAAGVLGGGTETGPTGVSLSPKIDPAAASGAAASFSAAFVSAVESSTLGADLSTALMVQVSGSVALVEQTGRDAGDSFVAGFTSTFVNIPTAFIAAVVNMAMPGIMANISNNGGRTGASEV